MRLQSYLREGIEDKGIFKAMFMAGHPGAGKSYVLRKVKSGQVEPRLVNTDKTFPFSLPPLCWGFYTLLNYC